MAVIKRLKKQIRSLRKADGGNVALIFGLALFPIIGMTGAAVDYTRASQLRTKMAVAADAAVLVAAKSSNLSFGQRKAAADATFAANLGIDPSLVAVKGKLSQLPGGGYRYEVEADYRYAVIKAVPGMGDSATLSVVAEAGSGEGTTEVALVLDNTGSMASDMVTLRKAATDFTNTLFDQAAGSGNKMLKMSVVPYVTAVNPGRLNLGMSAVDTRGESAWQASHLRGRYIAFVPNCNNNPFWVPPPNPGPPPPPNPNPGPGMGKGGKGVWLKDVLRQFADAGREMFGITSAAAQVGTYGTPNRTAPWSGVNETLNPPYVAAPTTLLNPTGFLKTDPCILRNPDRISNLDLFDGIRTKNGNRAQWKGCVEARPEPFDITDDPPSMSNPNTLFTPYLWPDEPGMAADGTTSGYVNNYLDDAFALPTGWSAAGEWERQASIFKYDGTNRNANIVETAPNTTGPNMACPDELLRLTDKRNDITKKIASLQHWNGGGTISSEGLMWGWRTLSPNAPFADGAAYGTKDNKKFLVIMTDGENELGENNTGGPTGSHYSSYGYLRMGRFPSENFQVAQNHLDSRLSLACESAKAKGIQIITILFRVTAPSTINMLRKCATDGKMFYAASGQAELQKAFSDVAALIGRIRLTK